MTTIYHDFPSFDVPLQGIQNHKTIISILKTAEQPIANIQYNNNNYTSESIVICNYKDAVGTFGYLVIKCYQDTKNTSSNLIYVTLPLVIGGNDVTETDIDKIINGIKENSSSLVTVDIDSYIDDSKKCTVNSPKEGGNFPATITFSEPITLKQTNSPSLELYENTNLSGLNISQTKNAQCQKKDLDWIMTCELLGDDGNVKDVKVNANPPTAITMSYFAMILLIVCASYYAGPMFYKVSGVEDYVKGNLDKFDHFSVNVFVGFNMLIAAVLSIFYGIQNGMVFVFIGLSLLLSYRAGTVSILSSKEISENYKNDNWFKFYSKGLFHNDDLKTRFIAIGSLFLLTIWISSMSTTMALKNDVGFSISLGVFVASIFLILTFYAYYFKPRKPEE